MKPKYRSRHLVALRIVMQLIKDTRSLRPLGLLFGEHWFYVTHDSRVLATFVDYIDYCRYKNIPICIQ